MKGAAFIRYSEFLTQSLKGFPMCKTKNRKVNRDK